MFQCFMFWIRRHWPQQVLRTRCIQWYEIVNSNNNGYHPCQTQTIYSNKNGTKLKYIIISQCIIQMKSEKNYADPKETFCPARGPDTTAKYHRSRSFTNSGLFSLSNRALSRRSWKTLKYGSWGISNGRMTPSFVFRRILYNLKYTG